MAGQRLSPNSEFEQMFGTRHRRPGRPEGADNDDVLFPAQDVHPLISRLAQRRAFAVVHEEQRDRLKGLYSSELRILNRRGLEQVAQDAGYVLVSVENEDGTHDTEIVQAGSARHRELLGEDVEA